MKKFLYEVSNCISNNRFNNLNTTLVNHSEGFISTVEIRRLKENIILLPITIKGKDSRFGFGFRLGNHADIQTIFEIGPQKYTNKPKGMLSNNNNVCIVLDKL